jgi:hypothetical protein
MDEQVNVPVEEVAEEVVEEKKETVVVDMGTVELKGHSSFGV